MTKYMEIRENINGIDYFGGDVHGCFTKLELALRRVGFDPSKDRLFLVGDLVDRGPESFRVVEFLKQKWVIAIQGNHDCSTYFAAKKQLKHDQTHDKDSLISFNNGGEWVTTQRFSVLQEFVDLIPYLPMAIEYQDRDGKPLMGLIHGEVAMGSSWTSLAKTLQQLPWDYVYSLEMRNGDTLHNSMYGRTKIQAAQRRGDYRSERYHTKGIDHVICGHTVVDQFRGGPVRVANNYYIDHGLYWDHDEAILYTLEQLIGRRPK